ncbi:hypothetical protein ACLZTU_13540 [Raoultella ornithinolytica]|uniref:hypothetical protein n=1 Tax=Raoultella ornithinolytica TaxID=54291 RepID=UPI0039B631C1
MSNGLAINIPTTFSRVLSDLSFIPDVKPDALAYSGFYGGSLAESIVNSAKGATASQVSGETIRNADRVSYGKGYLSVTGTGGDTSGGTGARADVNLTSLDKNGFPGSLVTAFRNIKKVRETSPAVRRLYPIASFYYNSTTSEGSPFLTIAAGIMDTGEKRIAAYSGSIATLTTDALAFQCSVAIDWSAADLISAGVSRAADGTVTLLVNNGGQELSSVHKFPASVDDTNVTSSSILYGSMPKYTLDSGEIMVGQYWHNTALTMSELQQQVALIHLKANARL